MTFAVVIFVILTTVSAVTVCASIPSGHQRLMALPWILACAALISITLTVLPSMGLHSGPHGSLTP